MVVLRVEVGPAQTIDGPEPAGAPGHQRRSPPVHDLLSRCGPEISLYYTTVGIYNDIFTWGQENEDGWTSTYSARRVAQP